MMRACPRSLLNKTKEEFLKIFNAAPAAASCLPPPLCALLKQVRDPNSLPDSGAILS
jgi:hypothetical protein